MRKKQRTKEVEEEKREEVGDGTDIIHPYLSLRKQGAALRSRGLSQRP